MFVVTFTVECGESPDTFREAARRCVAATREEDGCVEYRCLEDIESPGTFVFLERWSDRAAMDAHSTSEHVRAFGETVAALVVSARGVRYEPGSVEPFP